MSKLLENVNFAAVAQLLMAQFSGAQLPEGEEREAAQRRAETVINDVRVRYHPHLANTGDCNDENTHWSLDQLDDAPDILDLHLDYPESQQSAHYKLQLAEGRLLRLQPLGH